MSIKLQLDSDLVPLPENDTEESYAPYFDAEYRGSAILAGVFWVCMSIYSPIVVALIRKLLPSDSDALTSGTKNARRILVIGNGILFGITTTSWLLAYLDSQIMQEIYLHATTWSLPTAWTILLASLIEFIRGGKQKVSGKSECQTVSSRWMEYEISGHSNTWHGA